MKESSILQEKHNIKEESENKSPKKVIKRPKKGTSGKKKSKPESLESYLSGFFRQSFDQLKPKYKTLNVEMLKDQISKEIVDNQANLFAHL